MVGEPVPIHVDELTWDDEIDAPLARHQVSQDDVVAVTKSDFLSFNNLPDRGGTQIMIGPDKSGRILYVSIKPTSMPGVWSP